MPGDIKVGPNKAVSMTTDFGHSPIGRLGGRKVKVGEGAKPRSKFGEIHEEVGTRARIANAFTTKGTRVESKVLAGLSDFGKSVGNTLGSLIPRDDGKPDFKHLLKDLASLRKEARPLTERGTDYQELLRTRVGMELTQFSEKGLKNLVTSLQSEDMGNLLTGLTEATHPEVLRIMEAVGEGETAIQAGQERQAMARDLTTIRSLVLAEVEKRLVRVTETFNAKARDFLENAPNPLEDPAGFADSLRFVTDALDALTGKCEAMGVDLPDGARLALDQVDQRLGAAVTLCVNRMTRFLNHPTDPHADPNEFARRLGKLMITVNLARDSCRSRNLEMPEAFTTKLAELGQVLENLRPGNPDVGQLTAKNTGRLLKAMKDFGLHQLDEALADRAHFFRQEAQDEYNDAFQPFRQALVQKDFPGIMREQAELKDVEKHFVDLLRDLGDIREGPQDRVDACKGFMRDALADLGKEDVLLMARSLNSPEMVQFGDILPVAGRRIMELGQEPEFERTGRDMSTRALDFGALREMVKERLDREGEEMPAQAKSQTEPMTNVSKGMMDALRQGFGVGLNSGGKWDFAGTRGEGPDRNDPSLGNGVLKCLDVLGATFQDPVKLIETGFGISTRLLEQNRDEEDPERLRGALAAQISRNLGECSREQLDRILRNLTSDETMNLRYGLSQSGVSRSENPSPIHVKSREMLVSVGITLDVLEEAVRGEMEKRGMQVPLQPRGMGEGELSEANGRALRTNLNHIRAWLSTPLRSQGQGELQGPRRERFDDLFNQPMSEDLMTEARDPRGTGLGVCRQFVTDFHRATYRIEEEGQVRPLSTRGGTREERLQSGIENLRAFCGNDPDTLFKVSQFVNQSSLMPFLMGMSYHDPEQNAYSLSDGRKVQPSNRQGDIFYTLSKNQDGSIKMTLRPEWRTVGVMDDRGSVVPMDPRASNIAGWFDVTLETDGRVTVGPVNYQYTANRSLNLIQED